MVKKIIQRVIVGVLVSLILVLIYGVIDSHAIDFSQGISGLAVQDVTWECLTSNSDGGYTQATWKQNCSYNDIDGIKVYQIRTIENFDVKEGDYFEVQLSFLSVRQSTIPVGSLWILQPNEWFNLVKTESNYQNINENLFNLCHDGGVCDGSDYTKRYYQVRQNDTLSFTFRAKKDYQGRIVIGNGSSLILEIEKGTTNIFYLNPTIKGWVESKSTSEVMEEDKSENENQGEQGKTDSNSSQQTSEQNTQNLLGFLGSFFGAFTSAQATNCNMDWGMSEYGFGVIDMCASDVPVELSTMLSIIILIIVIPMVLWLFNSIINAFKEFQQS